MTKIPGALLEPPAPAPAQQGKETGFHPPPAPDTPFAAVLDDHQARTAVAEGHRRADEAPAEDAALASLLGGVPLPADTVVADAAAGPAEPEPLGGRVLSPGEASREQARGNVLTRATRPIGVPADATALPLRPPVSGAPAEPATAPAPSLPIGPGAVGSEGRGDGTGAAATTPPAAARAARLADVLQPAVRPDAAAPADPSATPPAATAAARAQAAAEGDRPAQAATPAAPAVPAATPATPAAPSAAARAGMPLPTRGVGLEHAVETVRLALRAGAERGVTHARISLAPRELGSIEVHLRHTADGLVARVVAEHATAVQQLQQAGAELRRQLEQQGVTVLQLDIGASGEQGGPADRRASAHGSGEAAGGSARRGARDGDPLDGIGDAGAAGDEATTTLQLPNGALVDVLA